MIRLMRRLRENPIAFMNYFFQPGITAYQRELMRETHKNIKHRIVLTRTVRSGKSMFAGEYYSYLIDKEINERSE